MNQIAIENQRIRGPALVTFIKRVFVSPRDDCGVAAPFVEGLARADTEKRVIASIGRLGKALLGSEEWKSLEFMCWSGTMTAYTKPGRKLGRTIEYRDNRTKERWVFHVPKEYQKEKNAILVAEHPDYTLEMDGKNIVVHATLVDLVLNFPRSGGSYQADEKHGIPIEVGLEGDRSLNRISDRRVGPTACGFIYIGKTDSIETQTINLSSEPSEDFAMVVEAPANNADKKEGDEKWKL